MENEEIFIAEVSGCLTAINSAVNAIVSSDAEGKMAATADLMKQIETLSGLYDSNPVLYKTRFL